MWIINSTFTDGGEYECIVKSAVGQISSKSLVIVEGPPGPAGGVQVSIHKTSVTLQWTDGATHGSQINSYTISGRTNWNHTWINISHNVYATEIDRYTGQKEATIENILSPWSTYEFRVSAWNSLGMGPPSAPSPRHSTSPDKPFIAPYNIGGGGGKIGDLTITWTPLKQGEQNGPGIYYKVFWKRQNFDSEYQSLALREYDNTAMAVVHIPLEYFYTEYLVKVQAINSIGAGPISHEVVVFSAEDMPQVAPQLVVARSFNSTALNVSWVPIEQTREKVRGKLIGHRVKKIILLFTTIFFIFSSTIFRLNIGRKVVEKKIVFIIYHVQRYHGHLLSVYNQIYIITLKLWLIMRLVRDQKVNGLLVSFDFKDD